MRTFVRKRGVAADIRRIGVMGNDMDSGVVVIETSALGGTTRRSYAEPPGDIRKYAISIVREWLNEGFKEDRGENFVLWNQVPEHFTPFTPTPLIEAHPQTLVTMSPRLQGSIECVLTVGDSGVMNLWRWSYDGTQLITERAPNLMRYYSALAIPRQSVFLVDLAYQTLDGERDGDALDVILQCSGDEARAMQTPARGKLVSCLQVPIYQYGMLEIKRSCSNWLCDMIERYFGATVGNPMVKLPMTVTSTVERCLELCEEWRCCATLYAPDTSIGSDAFVLDHREHQIDGVWNVDETDWRT